MAPELAGAEIRCAAERREYALRRFDLLTVAGDLLTDIGTKHQSVSADGMTSDALAELVALSQRVAQAVAGLDSWETAQACASSRQYLGVNRSGRGQPFVVGADPPPAEKRHICDGAQGTAHPGRRDPGNGQALAGRSVHDRAWIVPGHCCCVW
jgi:hypothetical protein